MAALTARSRLRRHEQRRRDRAVAVLAGRRHHTEHQREQPADPAGRQERLDLVIGRRGRRRE